MWLQSVVGWICELLRVVRILKIDDLKCVMTGGLAIWRWL